MATADVWAAAAATTTHDAAGPVDGNVKIWLAVEHR